MQGHSIKNKSDLVPDEIFGRRLLISLNADKNELKDNIRCARVLLSSFPDLNIEINAHLLKYRHKNPEYLINGLKADRKGIESENGIKAGFVKAKKQCCQIIIIDLDKHPEKIHVLRPKKIARMIGNRKDDFLLGITTQCYIVFGNHCIKIDNTFFSRDLNETKDRIEKEVQKLRVTEVTPKGGRKA